MIPFAQATATNATTGSEAIMWIVLVIGLSQLLNLALSAQQWIRSQTGLGKDNERKIEPTQIAAILSKLDAQAGLLTQINRELGEIRTSADRAQRDVDVLSEKQNREISSAHQRLDRVSETVAEHEGRLDALERAQLSRTR